MADHSNVVTDLTIKEVVNLPTGADIDDSILYFRTNDKTYSRAVPPVGDTPKQATYLIATAGGADGDGLEITVGKSVAFRELSNRMKVMVFPGDVTSATLLAQETPQKLKVLVADGDTFAEVKRVVDDIPRHHQHI